MQAHEDPTPDFVVATGFVVGGSVRFGSQVHPAGGLRFGAQAWAGLGPNGPMAAVESGADTAAAIGWLTGVGYSFEIFTVRASFVDYSSESIGLAISGTLDDGYKVLLPIAGPGASLTWEVNDQGNPSLRLSNLTGATNLSGVPWYVWDGSTWTAATFDVSDATQGAVFMVETGADTLSVNGSQTRYGVLALVEAGADFVVIDGGVAISGAFATVEIGADTFAATGSPSYVGAAVLLEAGDDALAGAGTVAVTGSIATTESAGDAFIAAGVTSIGGALATAESGADTFVAIGGLSIGGALSANESSTADTMAAIGIIRVSGAWASIEHGADGFSSTGRIERIGVAALVEAGFDSFALNGAILVLGALNADEEADRFDAAGFRSFSGNVIAAEIDALEGGSDSFLARGLARDLPPIPDFDGQMSEGSGTKQFTIRSRQQAAAA